MSKMDDLIGAKIVSINYPMQNGDNNIECTEVIIEKEGKKHSIRPCFSSYPRVSGQLNLIFISD